MCGGLPFSTLISVNAITNPCWDRLVKNFDERLHWPTRKYIARHMIPEYDRVYVDLLKKELEFVDFVAINCDIWSSKKQRGYLGVTVHFIDSSWNLRNHLLACTRFEGKHGAEEIFKLVIEILEKFNIRKKVIYVGTDNGGNVVKAFEDWMPGFMEGFCDENNTDDGPIEAVGNEEHDIDYLSPEDLDSDSTLAKDVCGLLEQECVINGRSIQLRCVAHTMQLCLKNPVKNCGKLNAVIEKLAKIVSSAKKSPQQTEQIVKVFGREFTSRCVTRWNTNYKMVQVAVKYNWEKDGLIFKEKHRLTTEDVRILQDFINVTSTFEQLFLKLQSASYPTVCQVIPAVYLLRRNLQTYADNPASLLKLYARDLLTEVNTRFCNTESDSVYIAALFLDPNYKAELCDCGFGTLTATEMKAVVIGMMERVNLNISPVEEPVPLPSTSSNLFSVLKKPKLSATLQTSAGQVLSVIAEYEMYMCEIDQSFGVEVNPLVYWKSKADKYKRLSRIAQQILCAPATTAGVERIFSVAGYLLSERRLRTTDYNFETLLFCSLNRDLKQRGDKRTSDEISR
ncbi:E3 SUMO-protein ligase ZBED1-like [Paramacrobiotus metropolitanus]|uniref:E3 SUMO-protein ligase ZBED1-like n=1 Tax=Paramacrobiotus metropolitanus TaxID=2943436 RepID=UPI002445734E|nr:E3 SUMO-protein ligase ZBED1-like [Paramacrobiotus metropolitanus]